jgi:hypothetical protein
MKEHYEERIVIIAIKKKGKYVVIVFCAPLAPKPPGGLYSPSTVASLCMHYSLLIEESPYPLHLETSHASPPPQQSDPLIYVVLASR